METSLELIREVTMALLKTKPEVLDVINALVEKEGIKGFNFSSKHGLTTGKVVKTLYTTGDVFGAFKTEKGLNDERSKYSEIREKYMNKILEKLNTLDESETKKVLEVIHKVLEVNI